MAHLNWKQDSRIVVMIYLIQNLNNGFVKIGRSANPQKRLRQLQTGSGDKLTLLRTYSVANDVAMERRLHSMFWQSKKKGEWFNFPSPDYLAFIDEFLT